MSININSSNFKLIRVRNENVVQLNAIVMQTNWPEKTPSIATIIQRGNNDYG